MSKHTLWFSALFLLLVACVSTAVHALPPGFQEITVFQGLQGPTAVRFAPDNSVFVSQLAGVVVHYDNISDTTATITADLTSDVQSGNGDVGLLGLAVHPQYGQNVGKDFIYALYTRKNTVTPSGRLLKIAVNPATGVMITVDVDVPTMTTRTYPA